MDKRARVTFFYWHRKPLNNDTISHLLKWKAKLCSNINIFKINFRLAGKCLYKMWSGKSNFLSSNILKCIQHHFWNEVAKRPALNRTIHSPNEFQLGSPFPSLTLQFCEGTIRKWKYNFVEEMFIKYLSD